jgi:hypothetical protein
MADAVLQCIGEALRVLTPSKRLIFGIYYAVQIKNGSFTYFFHDFLSVARDGPGSSRTGIRNPIANLEVLERDDIKLNR